MVFPKTLQAVQKRLMQLQGGGQPEAKDSPDRSSRGKIAPLDMKSLGIGSSSSAVKPHSSPQVRPLLYRNHDYILGLKD